MGARLNKCSVGVVAIAHCDDGGWMLAIEPTGRQRQTAATATTPRPAPTRYRQDRLLAHLQGLPWPWSSDAQIMRLSQKEVRIQRIKRQSGHVGGSGRSPSLHQFRLYTYSIADALRRFIKGTTAGTPRPWSGPTRDAMPIDVSSSIPIRTPRTSLRDRRSAWLARIQTSRLPRFELGNTAALNAPVWYIAWGEKKSGGYVAW